MLRNLAVTLSYKSFNSRLLILAATLAIITLSVSAQTRAQNLHRASDNAQASEPVFREYKGVTLGMNADEVRRKLGEPKEKNARQDFYAFSEKETAQVFYDNAQKVTALAINYLGEGGDVPDCKTVLGVEIKAEADGSMHKAVQYGKAGYRVSYNRTGGEDPLITVTMQKTSQSPEFE